MLSNFMASEMKKWLRDPLMRFMLFYPILLAFIGRYGVPWIAESAGFLVEHVADLIVVIIALLIPQIYGALMGFSILEDRDDRIFTSINVTPLKIHQFLSVKFMIMIGLSFVASIFVIWFSDITTFTWGQLVLIALLLSLLAPFTGLLINSLASNKIEGFAVKKGVGVLLVFPVVALFFFDAKELIFAIAPGYWPAKVISSMVRGEGVLFLPLYQYVLFGFMYVILLNVLMYRVFLNKTID